MEMDPPPPMHANRRRRCRDYLLALEEERRKIQVFQRELPLCLDLVTQTIEGVRSQMNGVGSEETVSDHGPVLEVFMPLKPSLSPSSSEEEHESIHHAAAATDAVVGSKHEPADTPPEANKATLDWLQSVQLWSQEPQQHAPSPHKDVPCKPLALKARKGGGAFQPFDREKRAEVPASASSAVVGDSSGDKASVDTDKHSDREMNKESKGQDKDKEGQSQPSNRKPRRCWAPELHRRFLQALQQLGGSHVATPKQIRELMKVDGLTNDEVKSHLQKYRLHTRRPNSTVQSSRASAVPPAAQFVVVGGIWVPPPECAAAAAAAAAAGAQAPQVQLSGDALASGNTVYAPVATLPAGVKTQSQQEQGRRPASRCSDGRRSDDAGGDASSASPAASSSSQTTSA